MDGTPRLGGRNDCSGWCLKRPTDSIGERPSSNEAPSTRRKGRYGGYLRTDAGIYVVENSTDGVCMRSSLWGTKFGLGQVADKREAVRWIGGSAPIMKGTRRRGRKRKSREIGTERVENWLRNFRSSSSMWEGTVISSVRSFTCAPSTINSRPLGCA